MKRMKKIEAKGDDRNGGACVRLTRCDITERGTIITLSRRSMHRSRDALTLHAPVKINVSVNVPSRDTVNDKVATVRAERVYRVINTASMSNNTNTAGDRP